jgi:8-oxo-dGTP pyrophosphatase MutT (NUDIX family)
MLLSSREVFRGWIARLTVDTVTLPNGHTAELEILHHPGGAAAVAIDREGRVCLLHQFRHAAGGHVWELPAGRLEPGEPPIDTIRRELAEEAGLHAAQVVPLGESLSSPGIFTERIHLFLATDLTPVPDAREAAEVFDVHWVPLDEAVRRALEGEIDDSKTVIGLLRARHELEKQS